MLTKTMLAVIVAFSLVCGALAHAQLNVHVDQLRFRLVGDEPIGAPDGHGIIIGWKAVVIRDLKTEQCYLAFTLSQAIAVTGPNVCP